MTDAEQQELTLSLPTPDPKPGIEVDNRRTGNEARSSAEFPRDPSGLPRELLEQHYLAMRRSHVFLSRSRGQLQRRTQEGRASREHLLATLRNTEARLMALGQEKAEALAIAKDMHRELELFEEKQLALDKLLDDFDAAKDEAGFWSIIRLTELLQRMRQLLRGRSRN
mgnify:CR=1 FL=1